MMINDDIPAIDMQKKPKIGMSISPGVEPGVVISPPDGKVVVVPGYRVRFNGVLFMVGVSCEPDLLDDCSVYPYREDYQNRAVYVRYIQTSDRQFRTREGSAVGDSWVQTIQRIGEGDVVYSGNDSCVHLPSGWHACIDLMSTDRKFDLEARRLLPKKSATIDFYYRIDN